MYQKKKEFTISADAALAKVQFICSRQEKCCSDIRKKLQNWNLTPDDQDKVIESLIENKFIDEERYTNFYVRDKFRFNRWGRIKIIHHLKQKQIPEWIISTALEQIDEKEYADCLHDLLVSKMRSIKEDDSYQLKAKLFRFAQSRGFESSIILSILEDLIAGMK
ncbi:regulatory protein RecX [Ancylomarina longa]|uniref:Regulatory protein RecX n=1 Tax=Ancylomarina longa TaxID=2487017 RepID=A0A434AGI1_9BACT|nr:regulatory protein RecX [Ancylomarina longa]RUT73513.1 RecX family transcriptional regulator [Ancylomarina longa]